MAGWNQFFAYYDEIISFQLKLSFSAMSIRENHTAEEPELIWWKFDKHSSLQGFNPATSALNIQHDIHYDSGAHAN